MVHRRAVPLWTLLTCRCVGGDRTVAAVSYRSRSDGHFPAIANHFGALGASPFDFFRSPQNARTSLDVKILPFEGFPGFSHNFWTFVDVTGSLRKWDGWDSNPGPKP